MTTVSTTWSGTLETNTGSTAQHRRHRQRERSSRKPCPSEGCTPGRRRSRHLRRRLRHRAGLSSRHPSRGCRKPLRTWGGSSHGARKVSEPAAWWEVDQALPVPGRAMCSNNATTMYRIWVDCTGKRATTRGCGAGVPVGRGHFTGQATFCSVRYRFLFS